MTRLFIHIGAHKTGTTAMQSIFDGNRDRLAAAGLHYPSACHYHHAHHRLAFAMKGMRDPAGGDRPDLGAEVAALLTDLGRASAPTALISSEEFFSAPAASIARLRACLGGRDVRIVATVRRPDALFLSIWNQKAKQPGNGFARMAASFLDDPAKLDPDLAMADCIARWTAEFGGEALTLLCHEDGPPVARMLDAVGLPKDLLPDATGNESLPGAAVEAMRLAKAVGLEPAAQRKLMTLSRDVFSGWPPYHMAASDRRRIVAAFEAANDEMFARAGRTNPYRADALDYPADRAEPNIRLRDLMLLLGEVLDAGR